MSTATIDDRIATGPVCGPIAPAAADDHAARVRRGASFLDAEEPGWAGRIDPEYLVMDNPYICILGQLFDHFCRGVVRLTRPVGPAGRLGAWLRALAIPPLCLSGTQRRWAHDHGFHVPDGSPDAYAALTRLWVAEVAARRASTPGA